MTWGKSPVEGWWGGSSGVRYSFVLGLAAGLCVLYPSLGDSSLLLPPRGCSCAPDVTSSLLLLSVNVLVSAFNFPVPGPVSLASPGCPTTFNVSWLCPSPVQTRGRLCHTDTYLQVLQQPELCCCSRTGQRWCVAWGSR